jgi:hypothetical protein
MLSGANNPAYPQQSASSITQSRVLAMSSFKQNEGCITGFRRLGYTVTSEGCVKMAKEAGITPIWDNTPLDDINAPPRMIVPVKAGDIFAVVVEKNGKKKYILYNSKK